MDNLPAMEIKSVHEEDGTFTGYAAYFGNQDSAGDRINPGAFKQAGETVPLLAYHDPKQVIGTITLSSDGTGVVGNGKLLLDTQAGREMYSRLRAQAVKGLSVGIRILKHVVQNGVRVIQSMHVAEVSCVPFPANPAALVTSVKAADTEHPCPARVLLSLLGE
jgi:uncharacterized protein